MNLRRDRTRFRASCALLLAATVTSPDGFAQDNRAASGMAVSVIKTARRCFRDTVPVSGFLEPRGEILVRADREGLVLSDVAVQPGDSVASGQVLARLANPMTFAEEGTVTAPVAGTVLESTAVVGAYASPSAPDPLFRVLLNGELELKADTLSVQSRKLKPGQTVSLVATGVDGAIGVVRAVDRGVDGTTQLGTVRISVPADARLRAGAFMRADVDTGETCGVAVPLSAILYGRDGPLVETVRNGRVEVRSVEVGVIAGGDAEIRSGLPENETVVARAGSFLREGDPVRPVVLGADAKR